MILLSITLTNLFWIIYSLTEGAREGFYWHYENKSKRVCDFDVNPLFNLQRLLVLIISTGFLFYNLEYFSILNSVCMILIFPFFHNGTYYYTRNKLDINAYPKRWIDESKTFPIFSPLISYKKRTIAMLIGIIAQMFIYLFLL